MAEKKTYCWSSSESPGASSVFSPGMSSESDFTLIPAILFFRMPFIWRGAAIPAYGGCQVCWLLVPQLFNLVIYAINSPETVWKQYTHSVITKRSSVKIRSRLSMIRFQRAQAMLHVCSMVCSRSRNTFLSSTFIENVLHNNKSRSVYTASNQGYQ